MPDNNNNIFLTTENLAFSLPLIIVCVTYVYFTYVPLHIGIPLLVALFVLDQIRRHFKKIQDKKLTNLDEGAIKDIIGELEDDEAFDDKENTSDSIAVQKAKHRVQLRLAMEKKAAARKGGRKGGDDDEDNNNNDDDVADLTTFAKNASSGTTAMKSKKK